MKLPIFFYKFNFIFDRTTYFIHIVLNEILPFYFILYCIFYGNVVYFYFILRVKC